jgi:hypothetical protein
MTDRRERRVRLATGAVLALVFLGGILVGFALDRGVVHASTEREGGMPEVRSDASPPNDWIIDRLEMTVDQRARVDSVLAHFGSHMSDLQKDYRPRFQSVVDSANFALRELLTEEQRIRYDSLEAHLERRRARNQPGRN